MACEGRPLQARPCQPHMGPKLDQVRFLPSVLFGGTFCFKYFIVMELKERNLVYRVSFLRRQRGYCTQIPQISYSYS